MRSLNSCGWTRIWNRSIGSWPLSDGFFSNRAHRHHGPDPPRCTISADSPSCLARGQRRQLHVLGSAVSARARGDRQAPPSDYTSTPAQCPPQKTMGLAGQLATSAAARRSSSIWFGVAFQPRARSASPIYNHTSVAMAHDNCRAAAPLSIYLMHMWPSGGVPARIKLERHRGR